MVFPSFHGTEEMANYIREIFKWHLKGASRPPQSLLKNHRDLCPSFTLSDVEEATWDFDVSEMTQATFYAMVVNDAVELGVMSRDMASALKSALEGQTNMPCWGCNSEDKPIREWDLDRRAVKKRTQSRVTPHPLLGTRSSLSFSFKSSKELCIFNLFDFSQTPDQLMAEGSYEGNCSSASRSHRTSEEVRSASTSSSVRGQKSSSSHYTHRLLIPEEVVLRKGQFPKWWLQGQPSQGLLFGRILKMG
ncbi:hypothetical protein Cgig2_032245 [Carnegiea gigantea]|uniref:Uncharacterized protein n=1 Tax=Carnegiea gigantea TaxID=171969 RepID=A0A9Q1Q7M1_9CARY|nr:hypothetical protein Cgig2_032245 [Carnegiea gigantea]